MKILDLFFAQALRCQQQTSGFQHETLGMLPSNIGYTLSLAINIEHGDIPSVSQWSGNIPR